MAAPIEYAMMVLKAPIDRHGYSDLPPDRIRADEHDYNPDLQTPTNQEQEDFEQWMKEQGHPEYRGPTMQEPAPSFGSGYDKHTWPLENPEEWKGLVDKFNLQYESPAQTEWLDKFGTGDETPEDTENLRREP